MLTPLFDHIKRFAVITAEDEELMCKKLIVKTYKKKEFLLKPGKVCRADHFVSTGLLRMYFINNKMQEQIIKFGLEDWWVTDLASFDSGQVSRFYIQALEDTEVVIWNTVVREELLQAIPQLETYFRKMLQKSYAASQRRLEFIYGMTDEERYQAFSTRFPGFVQRVPQYMLASYLGFTPQFLSKIRAKRI